MSLDILPMKEVIELALMAGSAGLHLWVRVRDLKKDMDCAFRKIRELEDKLKEWEHG